MVVSYFLHCTYLTPTTSKKHLRIAQNYRFVCTAATDRQVELESDQNSPFYIGDLSYVANHNLFPLQFSIIKNLTAYRL